MTRSFISTLISWLLIALFLYAAISKLADVKAFVSQMNSIDFLKPWAPVLAWLVPVIEIFISLLLAFSSSRLTGLYASFFLMLGFTIYIFVLLHFGSYMVCSCGGVISKLSMKQHLWFNIAITLLAGTGVYLTPLPPKPPQNFIAQ